nr:alpha/beta hydrolase [Pseudoduganella violacea]
MRQSAAQLFRRPSPRCSRSQAQYLAPSRLPSCYPRKLEEGKAVANVQANGITITYEASGHPSHPVILLNMGLGLQLISWPRDFVDGLVDLGYRVIRYDNRDAGLSTKFDHAGSPNLLVAYLKNLFGFRLRSAYTLDDMASDARGLLDVLGIAKAHIIGASMGGMIAQIFAARYPQRTLSLTSIMSSSGRPGLPGPTAAARKVLLQKPPSRRTREDLVAHMYTTFRTIGSPAYPMPERQLRGMIECAIRRNVNPDGMARQLVAIAASGDRSALLQTIACPALVIHGAADPLVPAACGIDTARQIPGAALHVIEGMGHDLPPQLTERLLGLIDIHLQSKMAAPQPTRNELS